MAQFHDTPDRYLALMRASLPLYDELQDAVAEASANVSAERILDLGTGPGETARRCLGRHPRARVVLVDASRSMLEIAASGLGPRVERGVEARLEDPLPEGPFDLVISALAVHHLDSVAKADLFHRIRDALAPGGVFVMADVVIPDAPVTRPTPLDTSVDRPEKIADLVCWLIAGGLSPELPWRQQDLVVLRGRTTADPVPAEGRRQ